MKNQLSLILFSLIVLLLWTCRKDEICNDPMNWECPNFDACTLVVPAIGTFSLLDSVKWADTTYTRVVDTILSSNPLYFKADNVKDMESYEWRIGNDARTFTEPFFDLSFEGFEGLIDVDLKTRANDPLECLLSDQLEATTTQSFYVSGMSVYNTQVWGNYEGSNIGNEEEMYSITLIGEVTNVLDSKYLYGIKLPEDCEVTDTGIPLGAGYSFFVSVFVNRNSSSRCRNLTVIGELSKENRDELKIDYWYDADDGTRQHEIFVGYRQ